MSHQNRREFLKRAAGGGLVAATFAIGKTKPFGGVLGANDRIRVALVGLNGRGKEHLKNYCKIKNVEIAYFVDPDARLFESRLEMLKQQGSADTPKCVQNLHAALEDKNLDVVSIATPNHWHSLQGIWACQAGKDVYVEKPCSHNIYEGHKLVEAARKYDRIVQHGTQSRSSSFWARLAAAARSGKYGRLLVAYGYASKPRKSIGFKPAMAPPKELDFDIWTGPAPKQPYHENLVHYNWHWMWDFGNGEIGNQGVHQMDIARWGLPDGAEPKAAISMGGRFGYQDQGQTPNTQLTVIDCGGPKIIFEDRGLVDKKTDKVTNEFYTDEGVLIGDKFFPKGKKESVLIEEVEVVVHQDRRPFHNFIECVRNRKRENLNAEILEGHRSALLCHLGNISYRLGKEVSFNKAMNVFGDDTMVGEAFESMKRHVAKMDPEDTAYRLGRKLAFDPVAEKFIGDAEADKHLAGSRREPYVVPENV
jgi:predicted dehydrogenase